MEASSERRCKASNKRGEPCGATIVGADGFCMAHSPTSPLDMREMGRRGGSARSKPAGSESLREYLRRAVPPERVWAALEKAMQGSNESARVAAVRVLAQELYEPEREREQGWHGAALEVEVDTDAVLSELFEIGLIQPGPAWSGPTVDRKTDPLPPDHHANPRLRLPLRKLHAVLR